MTQELMDLRSSILEEAKELPALIESHLVQLPGGQDWIDRRK